MEASIDHLALKSHTMPKPAAPISAQLRLVADNKRDLDEMILAEQGRGWLLISRGYSLDEGHGATLIRKDLVKAA